MWRFQEFNLPLPGTRSAAEAKEANFILIDQEDCDDPNFTIEEFIEQERSDWEGNGDGTTEYEMEDETHVVRFYQNSNGEKILYSVLKVFEIDSQDDED